MEQDKINQLEEQRQQLKDQKQKDLQMTIETSRKNVRKESSVDQIDHMMKYIIEPKITKRCRSFNSVRSFQCRRNRSMY